MNQPEPNISVVVPVHNCSKTVGKCLESLLQLDYPSFEIIVVDDGSTDSTARICRSYGQVHVVELEKGGPSRARNVAIDRAKGKFVAFTDGDCIVDGRWLTELEKGFTRPDVAGVGGDQRSPDDDSDTGKLIHHFLKTVGFVADYVKTDSVLKETEHNPTCNAMYRKTVLKEVGGFNEHLWPGEDVELDLKIRRRGYTLIYNPSARVAHYRPETYRGFAGMFKRYGAAQGYLVREYGLFRRIHCVPIVLLVGSVLLAVLAAWYPIVLLIALLALPVLFSWFSLTTGSFGRGIQFTLLMLILLITWNWGFFVGFLTGKGCRPQVL